MFINKVYILFHYRLLKYYIRNTIRNKNFCLTYKKTNLEYLNIIDDLY